MTNADKPASPRHSSAALRQRTEELLTSHPAADTSKLADKQKILHELPVHQIELSMQNEELQAAQAEIRAGLASYTDLYDLAPVGFFSLERDSTISLVNLAGAGLLQAAPTQLIGRRLGSFVDVVSLPTFNAFLARVFAGHGNESCELMLRPEAGSPALTVHIGGVCDERKQGCKLVVIDITERKKLEELIRQREQYQRALLDNIPCLIWLKDEQSRFLAVNKPFAATFGWPSPESLVGKSDFDIAPGDLAETYREDDRNVLENQRGKCVEELIETTGERRWFETYKSPVSLDGRVIGTVGFARDISERRAMEESLRESEAFNIAVLNSLSALIVVLDENARVIAANTAWQEFTANNYPPELAARSPGLKYCMACVATISQSCEVPTCQICAGIEAVVQGAQDSFSIEYPFTTPGASRWFRMRAHCLPGKRRGAVVAHEDITELKQAVEDQKAAKAEAEQSNNAKSRFLAAASHDLRQPLAALSIYVGLLKNMGKPSDTPLIDNMVNCVSSLSELLSDLLDVSKLDAGVVRPELTDFSVTELLENLVSVHAPEAALKGLRLGCLAPDLTAHTDPILFQRIIGNLIANAIRFTEHGGVLVAGRRRQGKTWIEVWDTGIGIPEEKISEVFEEFTQLGHDDRNRGSGLGLAIVAKTAALLNLQIRVRSRPGRGSMFAIEVPPGRASATRPRRQPRHRLLHIALVEDNLAVRTAMTYALEAMGHQVVAAPSGKELLDALASRTPDIIISDFRLAHGETGFEAIAAAREVFGEKLPALLITGDTDPKLMRSMADRGIVVQHKPLEIEALQVCIDQLMNRRRT